MTNAQASAFDLTDPWSDLLPECGIITFDPFEEMLRLIAYDIADPKRLRRVAEACEDYGVRVQKSLFECWLEEPRFQQLWARLQTVINPEEDALAAYVMDRAASRRRLVVGQAVPPTLPNQRFIL